MNIRSFIRKSSAWITGWPWTVIAKTLVVICAFLAFCLSMREKEFNRFSEIKPIFEIISLKNINEFKIINHGGVVFFIGCLSKQADLLKKTPRQFSALTKYQNDSARFEFLLSRRPKADDTLSLYWRDADLNMYEMKIGLNRNNFMIDDVPKVKRSTLFYSMSRKWIDWVISIIFPKDWYTDFKVIEDKNYITKEAT